MSRKDQHWIGVRKGESGSFHAQILREGRFRHCGSWPTAELAALACDRAALFFDPDDERLNLPTQSRRAGPCPPEELQRQARLRKRRFRGIWRKANLATWYVQIMKDGVRYRVGGFPRAEQAALGHDRLILFLGMPRELLNFPERCLEPASVEVLRGELGTERSLKRSSPYLGVSLADGKYNARVFHGREYAILGFDDAKEAARARDRLALWLLGGSAQLNFPRSRLLPASFETLREERRQARRDRYSSRYIGVRFVTKPGSRLPWSATIFGVTSGRGVALGSWSTERAAALAVDRAALYYLGDAARLNFPRRARELGPANARALRREAWHEFKALTSSRFRGVWWDQISGCWSVKITHEGRPYELGRFDDEEAAARAYDRAAIQLHGGKAHLNFAGGSDAGAASRRS